MVDIHEDRYRRAIFHFVRPRGGAFAEKSRLLDDRGRKIGAFQSRYVAFQSRIIAFAAAARAGESA
jgi:hypothetical protein